jgi:hypothetical protein
MVNNIFIYNYLLQKIILGIWKIRKKYYFLKIISLGFFLKYIMVYNYYDDIFNGYAMVWLFDEM